MTRLIIIIIICLAAHSPLPVRAQGLEYQELIAQGDRLKAQDEYAPALDAYRCALGVAEKAGDRRGMARAQLGIGKVYVLQVKFSHALKALHQSLALSESIRDMAGMARANDQLGYVYYRLYYPDATRRHLGQALAQFEAVGDRGGMASVLNHMGRGNICKGSFPEYVTCPFDYYMRSIRLGEASSNEEALASALSNLGNLFLMKFYAGMGAHYVTQAEASYRRALAKYEALGSRRGQGLVLGNLSRTFHVMPGTEAKRKAIEYGARSVSFFKAIGDDDDLWEAYWNLGIAHADDPEQALHHFAEAIKIIERMRQAADGDELTLQRYFIGQTGPYHAMVDLLVSLNRLEEALAYVEKAKARVLLDILASARASQSLQLSRRGREREQSISGELAKLNRMIRRESQRAQPSRQYLAELRGERQRIRQALLDFRAQAATAQPEARATPAETRPPSLAEAAELLPDKNGAILEYFGNNLFVLTRPDEGQTAGVNVKAYKIAHGSHVDLKRLYASSNQVDVFHRQLSGRDNEFHSSARAFYDMLIAPAREQLRGKTSLIVLPDGLFWNVPFQALLDEENRYLIETAAISYAPSLSVLREMRRTRQANESAQGQARGAGEESLLALGNPALRGETVARVRGRFRDARLEPLPEAEREVARIGQLYEARLSKVLVRAKAREGLLKKEAGRYGILHLAMHAVISNEHPMYSSLVLSQSGKDSGGDEDGMLEAWEIVQLRLRARLAVLSACSTAGGDAIPGEGMIGLSWAFLAAGVPTIVVSQWNVESASTSELMIEFHRQLRQAGAGGQASLTKAEALRQAALKLMKKSRSRHPFYWAAFVIVGDGE